MIQSLPSEKIKSIEFKAPVITPANPYDSLDVVMHEIQQLCRVSWSENEIIMKIEEARVMRRNDKGVTTPTAERWG